MCVRACVRPCVVARAQIVFLCFLVLFFVFSHYVSILFFLCNGLSAPVWTNGTCIKEYIITIINIISMIVIVIFGSSSSSSSSSSRETPILDSRTEILCIYCLKKRQYSSLNV